MREAADFDVEDFEDRNRSDPKALVRFFIMPLKDEKATRENGRAIYVDTEMCEVIVPGNQTNKPVKRVNDLVRQRYAAQYKRWKDAGGGDVDLLEGTHLREVPWVTRSQVEELAYFNIRTMEQLAVVNDDVCGRIPGLYELKRRAKAMMDKAEKDAPILRLQAQIDELSAKLEVKDQTIADLSKQVKAKKKED